MIFGFLEFITLDLQIYRTASRLVRQHAIKTKCLTSKCNVELFVSVRALAQPKYLLLVIIMEIPIRIADFCRTILMKFLWLCNIFLF